MATAADCPGKFDVIINGNGYMLDSTFDPSVYFKSQKASYGFTPTFLERTNVGTGYGDDQQAFWMTVSQNDWSGGDGQRFFKTSDTASVGRFFSGSGIETNVPGEITLGPFESSSATVIPANISAMAGAHGNALVATDTNAYRVDIDSTGSGTLINLDMGAHGAGAVVKHGICEDMNAATTSAVYVAGATKIRKYNPTAGTWADFSATVVTGTHAGIFYLNNALYGWDDKNLYTWSTAGARTTIFTWQDAAGTATPTIFRAVRWGPKIAVLIGYDSSAVSGGTIGSGTPLEVWLYDGNSTTMVWRLPPGHLDVADICESFGLLYVVQTESYRLRLSSGFMRYGARLAVYFFDGHTEGVVWRSNPGVAAGSDCAICATPEGVAVWGVKGDDGNHQIYTLSASNGASCPLGTTTITASNSGNTPTWLVMAGGNVGSIFAYAHRGGRPLFAISEGATATGYLTTSRFDFGSSVNKLFHGVKVDADLPTSTSVDIYYSVDGGTFTLLQAALVSGAEYVFSNVIGVSLQIQLRFHSNGIATPGGSTTPLVRRLYVRAAPMQETFRNGTLILNLSGNKNNPTGATMLRLRDDTTHSKDGTEMAADLVTAVESTSPIQITDRFGTITAIIEPAGFELHEMRTGWGRAEFRAIVPYRQV